MCQVHTEYDAFVLSDLDFLCLFCSFVFVVVWHYYWLCIAEWVTWLQKPQCELLLAFAWDLSWPWEGWCWRWLWWWWWWRRWWRWWGWSWQLFKRFWWETWRWWPPLSSPAKFPPHTSLFLCKLSKYVWGCAFLQMFKYFAFLDILSNIQDIMLCY